MEIGLQRFRKCLCRSAQDDELRLETNSQTAADENETSGGGLLGEVKELCLKYKIEDVSETYVDLERIRRRVTEDVMLELLLETKRVSKPLRTEREKERKGYFGIPKIEARAVFLHNVGELNVKTNRKGLSLTKFGDLNCPGLREAGLPISSHEVWRLLVQCAQGGDHLQ